MFRDLTTAPADSRSWQRYLRASTALADDHDAFNRCAASLVPGWASIATVILRSDRGELTAAGLATERRAHAPEMVAWLTQTDGPPDELFAATLAGDRPVLVGGNGGRQPPALAQRLARLEVASAIAAPIRFRRRAVGAVFFATTLDRAPPFRHADLDFTARLTERLALVIAERHPAAPPLAGEGRDAAGIVAAIDTAHLDGDHVGLAVVEFREAPWDPAQTSRQHLLPGDALTWLSPRRAVAVVRGRDVAETDDRLDRWIEHMTRSGALRGLGYADSLLVHDGQELLDRALRQAAVRRPEGG